jgi:polysaccharide export outer membrane protein
MTLRLVLLCLVVAGAVACRTGRDFLWIEQVPASMRAAEKGYQIGPGDVVAVRVWNHEPNSVERARVREDGKITLPLLDDVVAAGKEPPELARYIETKLKAFINAPSVTVLVVERRPLRVSIVGKVAHAGVFELDPGAGVLHAIAAAGGLTPFADEKRIFVLRSGFWADGNPEPARIRFRYGDLQAGKAPASLFTLQSGDILVVE